MKTSFLDKSTWKGILAWLTTCWVFFLGVFAADFLSFKIQEPDRILEQDDWNGLIDSLWGFTSSVNGSLINSEIPAWAVIIYAWSACPAWWHQWYWWWDRFILPLQSGEGTASFGSGQKTFTIKEENLPKHSHKVLYSEYGHDTLNGDKSLAVTNVSTTNVWDSDYTLVWSSQTANVGKSSEVWNNKPIEFMPQYIKVLFCEKDPASH